ncbi:NAD(P)-dependent dehydrogenase (short-subunit alcohol dehydrogenase family) [Pseudonocardia sediminis]|uniref:Probable oxidoreductase n=1 Tax=Pseudonocardia sediminis TaxID=1397368 RepID=A0A4Q7URG7_PSEST|nr:SDR family NAD(P)-dependent oxidoreductase [Pseudonocardia sediminis]RZT84285.1 NAD(P)-dependent dehydrogenase (short-subunit alcohol dehydrogenase family) [Pseudonocardia sediminis]
MTAPTLLRTPFDATTTADEVLAGVDLSSRRAVVTGAASGIGYETARALAGAGAEVTLAVRDVDAGERARAEIAEVTGNPMVRVGELDLAEPTSVARFVRLWDGPLHMLVNNAGVMATPETRTSAGWELQFATNHLGHFELATGLHWALTAVDGARIVSVSSNAHLRAGVDLDDPHFLDRPYDRSLAYAQSKSANVLFAVEAARRWADDGISVNALTPGGIRTGLQRHISDDDLARLRAKAGAGAPQWKTPQQGAATSVLLAASPLVSGVTGRYFEDVNEAAPAEPGVYRGVAAHALDPVAAAALWDLSERAVRDDTWSHFSAWPIAA